MKTKPENLKNELRKMVAEVLNVPANELTDEMSFTQEMNVDSLDILKLICRIEHEYNIEIDQDEIDLLDKLGTAYRYVRSLIDSKT